MQSITHFEGLALHTSFGQLYMYVPIGHETESSDGTFFGPHTHGAHTACDARTPPQHGDATRRGATSSLSGRASSALAGGTLVRVMWTSRMH